MAPKNIIQLMFEFGKLHRRMQLFFCSTTILIKICVYKGKRNILHNKKNKCMKILYAIPLMLITSVLLAFQSTPTQYKTPSYRDSLKSEQIKNLPTRNINAVAAATVGTINGKIKDDRGEELIGVSIRIHKNGVSTISDIEGNYSLRLEEGTHKIEYTYTGFASQIITVTLKKGETKKVDVILKSGVVTNEVVVTGYSSTRNLGSRAKKSRASKSESIVRKPTSSSVVTTPSAPTEVEITREVSFDSYSSTTSTIDYGSLDESLAYKDAKYISTKETHLKNSYFPAKSILLEGKMVSENLIPMAELNPLEIINIEKELKEKPKKKEQPKAGQLTAGENNDLTKWKEWKSELKKNDYIKAKKNWQFNLTNRYAVVVKNKNDQPIANAKVQLINAKKEILWIARTDNSGHAELWKNIFDENNTDEKLKIQVQYEGEKYFIKKPKPFKKTNRLTIDAVCNISNKVEIMFAVDATGSMGDEIRYLKTELQDVIQRVQSSDNELDVRLGAVFYRDEGDAYLTRETPLDSDIQQTVDFIKNQNARGGGDYPEAVDAALDVAINNQNWSEDAVARIVFLVLDAPPHMQDKNIQSLQNSIRLAAEKGIKIIPVTASGINRTTEYITKCMALATNGTYVFITDHSGIGSDHLEPSTSDFKVEFLNDLLVRLIGEFTDRKSCEEDDNQNRIADNDNQDPNSSTVIFKEDKTLLSKVKYFPNPATTNVTIQLQETISEIIIINSNGQIVKRLENVPAGDTNLDLYGLSEGFYLIRFKKDRSVASGKLIIIKP